MRFQPRLILHIIFAYVAITIVIVIYTMVINSKINTQEQQVLELSNNYHPSIKALSALDGNYNELKRQVRYWLLTPVSNDSLLRNEYNQIFAKTIYPLTTKLMVLADNWNETDTRLMSETVYLIKDSLYISLINFVKDCHTFRSSKEFSHSEILMEFEQSKIIFLFSEIEQNLSYLIDKKKSEANSILKVTKSYSADIQHSTMYMIISIIIIMILSLVWYYKFITKAFFAISEGLQSLSEGLIPSIISLKKEDPFFILYSRMNKLYNYLTNLIKLSTQILEKDFSGDIKPLGNEDQLGIALVNLQHSLKHATIEEEKRKKEDSERQWVSEGIARINDILRSSEDKTEELSYQIIKSIVNYTNSSLGALFVINNENMNDVFLEMSASYAYDRRKHLDKKISIGEGLVGRCAKEGETIHITEIPDNYLSIQSGLGESKPLSLLLVPLKLNNSVYGVIELATFNSYMIFQIKYIEALRENIATTISKMKINLRTTYLLEQTRLQTEKMSAQEEEMRLKMEELKSKQEELAIREEDLKKEIQHLKALVSKS